MWNQSPKRDIYQNQESIPHGITSSSLATAEGLSRALQQMPLTWVHLSMEITISPGNENNQSMVSNMWLQIAT